MSLKTAIFVDGANSAPTYVTSPLPPQVRHLASRTGWKSDISTGRASTEGFWQNSTKPPAGSINSSEFIGTGAASISPWPSSEQHRLNLAQRVINRHAEIDGLTPKLVIDLAHEWYRRERNYFERLREQVFENIQRRTDFLEFRYVGQYQVHPLRAHRIEQREDGEITYLGVQVGEKGVDTGIAVDMIAKMSNYDAAILVSGDADFLPVVGYLKDNLKYVYQFSVAKGVPPSIRYLSPYLRGKVDCFASFNEVELLGEYLNRRSGIPPAILDAIDDRISDLQGRISSSTGG